MAQSNQADDDSHDSAVMPLARLLGYGGLIPFAALAAGSLMLRDPALRAQSLFLLQIYALSIVSFVGALSWGMALIAPRLAPEFRARLMIWSVIPSLIGCASFACPPVWGCLILAATAALALAFDLHAAPRLSLPAPWRTLRWHLSLGAVAALLTGAHAARLLAA